jgi:hypothetical protein
MSRPRVFNPDDYLRTSEGRVFTAERNAAAWEQIYSELEAILAAPIPEICLYIVMGVQGSGKTTWIEANRAALGSAAVILDAASRAMPSCPCARDGRATRSSNRGCVDSSSARPSNRPECVAAC